MRRGREAGRRQGALGGAETEHHVVLVHGTEGGRERQARQEADRVRQAAVRRWRRRAFIGCSSGACGGFVCVTVYALESVAWEAA